MVSVVGGSGFATVDKTVWLLELNSSGYFIFRALLFLPELAIDTCLEQIITYLTLIGRVINRP